MDPSTQPRIPALAAAGIAFDEWIFLALVALLPIMQPFHILIGHYDVVLVDAIFLALATAFAAALASGRRTAGLSIWHIAVAGYFGVCTVSAMASSNVDDSLLKLAGIGYLCGLGILTSIYASTLASLRRAVLAWLVGAAVTIAAAAAGSVLFYGGVRDSSNIFLYSYGSLIPGPYPRVMALFLNANMLCSFVAVSAMLALSARKARWVPPGIGRALFAGSLLTALLTWSPGLGGLMLALAIWYSDSLRKRWPLGATALLTAGLVAAVAFALAITISPTMFDHDWTVAGVLADFEASSRMQTWAGAWNTFLANPWLGTGPGLAVARVSYVNASGGTELLTDAHNMWLSVLAQAGVLGFLAFLAVLLPLVVRLQLMAGTRSPGTIMRSGLGLALVAGLLYPSLSASLEDTRHVWVLLGMVAAVQAQTGAERSRSVAAE